MAGPMKVIYTDHARERMNERKIPEADVEHVLNAPETSYPGKNAGTRVAERNLPSGVTMKVVYQPINAGVKVISVLWRERQP